jgi:aerobic-type carbon monoxide dehydrogenase small subunit (CoxS/CutS family)
MIKPFCVVNGSAQEPPVAATTALTWLREEAGCTDVARGCETGHCGGCAVLLDGQPVKSCSLLAGELEGRQVHSLQGLAHLGGETFEALERAVLATQPFQCGYCKPAFMIAAWDFLEKSRRPGEKEIREAFAGLLCRCTGYQSIVDAVLVAGSARVEE